MHTLKAVDLKKKIKDLEIVKGMSLEVSSGEVVGLLGPNGAGKTTFFNVVSGFYTPTSGTVEFKGRVISGLPSSKIAKLGAVRTFQRAALFPDFTDTL